MATQVERYICAFNGTPIPEELNYCPLCNRHDCAMTLEEYSEFSLIPVSELQVVFFVKEKQGEGRDLGLVVQVKDDAYRAYAPEHYAGSQLIDTQNSLIEASNALASHRRYLDEKERERVLELEAKTKQYQEELEAQKAQRASHNPSQD